MKNKIFFGLLVMLLHLGMKLIAQTKMAEDNLITCDGIGKVKIIHTYEQLVQIFGAQNVVSDTIDRRMVGYELPPGELYYQVITYVHTPYGKVRVHWNAGRPEEGIAKLSTTSPHFRFRNGVHVGMKLIDLIGINREPIRFYGFGWQFGGTIAKSTGNFLGNEEYNCFEGYLKLPDDYPYSGSIANFLGDKIYNTTMPGLPKDIITLGEITIDPFAFMKKD